ncbi:9952_t:CDS:2 [Funneliformis caledonium]|uniref:9952_t:CDS:1 n=1 Tax=Funneliformis caledonium TaxID=1117310 RepID=A0A9N9CYI1_9GLOM|nr:9952_t:CDS:2 [Funneliformis caledonium]
MARYGKEYSSYNRNRSCSRNRKQKGNRILSHESQSDDSHKSSFEKSKKYNPSQRKSNQHDKEDSDSLYILAILLYYDALSNFIIDNSSISRDDY